MWNTDSDSAGSSRPPCQIWSNLIIRSNLIYESQVEVVRPFPAGAIA